MSPFHVFVLSAVLLDDSCPRPTLCETGSTLDIRLVPYKCGSAGVSFSDFSGHGRASEGLLEGIIEMIIDEMLWFDVHR